MLKWLTYKVKEVTPRKKKEKKEKKKKKMQL